jgi:hypothetical protein
LFAVESKYFLFACLFARLDPQQPVGAISLWLVFTKTLAGAKAQRPRRGISVIDMGIT